MIHNKGKLLLRLAALVAAVGISLVLVAHVALAQGSITIEKRTVPPGGTGFEFTDDIENPYNFTLDHGGTPKIFTNVSGTFAVTETNPAVIPGGGWTLTDVECRDINNPFWQEYTVASTTVTIELTNEVVECIFTNMQPRPPVVVGGYVVPVNKLEILAPWLALVAMASFAALTVALVKRRRA